MSQVTNITVGYDRKRQPAQYESSGARVEFAAILSATVGDNEDHVAIATKLLGEAKTIVLVELGLVKAGENASAVVVSAGKSDTVATGTAAGSKEAEKAAKAAAKAAKEAAKAPVTTGTDDAATRQITQNPENRTDPANPPAEVFPGEGPSTPATGTAANTDLPAEEVVATGAKAASATPTLTHTEMHAFIAGKIKDKKLDHPTVKATSAKYNVARIQDLKPEQLGPYKASIEEAMSKLGGNGDIMADL